MKEPYYIIDFNAAACLFEIRVNDHPILMMNLRAQAATRLPINFAIHKKGKQEVSIKMLPLLGQTQLTTKAQLSYTIKKYNTVNGFELQDEYTGFESKKINDKIVQVQVGNSTFEATIPYQLRDYWLEGKNIKDVEDYETKLITAYKDIIEIIKAKKFELYVKKITDREHNMVTSMYLSPRESRRRIQSIVNDFKNGYDHVIFDENAVPVISAYGKKVALKQLDGQPALAFGNKEMQEQLQLDIEFYYNKNTKVFEII